jgi:hypothetical protein
LHPCCKPAFAAFLALFTLAVGLGCAATPDGENTQWEEPGWMSQARQELEEYQSALMTCYSEHGVQGIVMVGGSVAAVTPTGASGEPLAGAQQLVEQAVDECDGQVTRPSVWSAPQDKSAYQRMLDVRSCLVAHGHNISEPPSMEVWLEQGSSEAWNPYSQLLSGFADKGRELSDDEALHLLEICPQTGIGKLGYATDGMF